MVQAMLDGDAMVTDAVAAVCLADAGDAIMRRLYPFGWNDTATIPTQYHMLQCKLAVRYYLRRGGEGERIHIENGIHRDYDTANDEDQLMEVTPYGKVM